MSKLFNGAIIELKNSVADHLSSLEDIRAGSSEETDFNILRKYVDDCAYHYEMLISIEFAITWLESKNEGKMK